MPPWNPFPTSCLLLNLALPGVGWFGWTLAGRLGVAADARRLLAPALAVAAWVVAIHAIGRTAGSYLLGLWGGTLVLAATGLGLTWSGRVRRAAGALSTGAAAAAEGDGNWRWMLATAALATAAIAPMALGHEFHDELFVTGHIAIVSEIGRGVYPPRHLTFPQFELRYHYGFNILVAALVALTRLPVTQAIDAVTLSGFFLTWCLLWAIGRRVAGGQLGGGLTALVTLFGGGLPWLAPLGESDAIDRAMSLSSFGGVNLNPPVISYVFQHPWSLGLPLGLAVLLLQLEPGRRGWRAAALAMLLVALAVSQFVLFASLAATLVAAESWNEGRPSLRRGAAALATAGVAVALASRLGGFFLPADPEAGSALMWHPGVADSLVDSLGWHVAAFGLIAPLAVAGLAIARRGRLPFLLLAAGGLLVINTLRYRYSWDIMKFATVAAIGLAVLAAAALRRLVGGASESGRIAGGMLALAATAAGLVYPALFLVAPGLPPEKGFRRHPVALDESEVQTARWLAERVGAEELVYARVERSPGFAQSAGVPQAFFDAAVPSFGFAPARLQARMKLLAEPPEEPDAFVAEGIRWFVVGPRDRINAQVDRWLRQGQGRQVARFGSLRIVRLDP